MRKSIEIDIRPGVFLPPTSDRGQGQHRDRKIGTAAAIEVGYSEYWQNCRETENPIATPIPTPTAAFPAALSGSQIKATGFAGVIITCAVQRRHRRLPCLLNVEMRRSRHSFPPYHCYTFPTPATGRHPFYNRRINSPRTSAADA